MNWQEILTILVPLLGLMAWVYNRIEKKAEERHNSVNENFKAIREELKEIRSDIKSIDQRLARLGAF